MEQLLRYAQWIAHSKLNVPQEKYPPGLAAELAVELQSLAVQLRKLVDSLHRLEFFRRDFIANISHEVKTPITAILASVENLKLCYKAQNNEISAECMASLERQTKRLHLLILDILHLAELEEMEEKDHKFFFPIEVKSLLEAIQMDLGELAGRVNIQLELISCGDEKILGDEELLQQAVSNLIMNAINHSQSSRIEFGAETEEGRVGIFVRDFGIGIPEEHQVRIFERFYRIDKARSQSSAKGTGLGLAIVKHIAQLHDASIICENSVPHGCTFSITFPRVTMAPGNTNRHSVKTV